MHDFHGKVAAVTGAASGLGRALCGRLAQEGCNLALVDVNERGLAETAAEVKRIGSRVSIHVIDVASRSQMEHLPEQILRQHPGIHLLIQFEATFVAERGLAVDRVADRIVRGIKRGAPRVLIGRETYLIDALARCCPVWTNSLIARFRRRIRFL